MSLVLNGVALCLCCSFAEAQKKYKSANDIDSATIAGKFQCISGTQIYGKVAWREWCTLERSLTQEALAWLGKVGARTKTDLPTVCQLIELVCFGCIALQVFLSGKMVVFNKNCLEIATKTTLFKTFAAGLDAEFQIAMLSNLVCFFDV